MDQGEEQLCLRRTNYSEITVLNMLKLLQSQTLVDVTLVAENGEGIRCHKLVLFSCSPFLEKMLSNQISSQKEPMIYLPEANYLDLSALILFMYKGEAIIPKKRIMSFMKLAESLKIQGLSSEPIPPSEVQPSPPLPPPVPVPTGVQAPSTSSHITFRAKDVQNIAIQEFTTEENIYVDVDPSIMQTFSLQAAALPNANVNMNNTSIVSHGHGHGSHHDNNSLVVGVGLNMTSAVPSTIVSPLKKRRIKGSIIDSMSDDSCHDHDGEEFFGSRVALLKKESYQSTTADWIGSIGSGEEKALEFPHLTIGSCETVELEESHHQEMNFLHEIGGEHSSNSSHTEVVHNDDTDNHDSIRKKCKEPAALFTRYSNRKNSSEPVGRCESGYQHRCTDCKNFYKTEASLRIHKKHHCLNPTRFSCEHCGKQTSRLQVLQSHYKTCKSKKISDSNNLAENENSS